MQEFFDRWNEVKKELSSTQTQKYPSVGMQKSKHL